jgi:hypothetical protein
MDVNYLDLVGEGYMGSMQLQLGREEGTIPAFASRTLENQENLGCYEKEKVQIHTLNKLPSFPFQVRDSSVLCGCGATLRVVTKSGSRHW